MKPFFSLFLLLLLLLASCGKSTKTYTIGVSQCVGGPWREKVNMEMRSAQHLYNADVKLIIRDADNDTELQGRQIDSLIRMGVDLLVVSPNENGSLTQVLRHVEAKGIPVIFFDREINTIKYHASIGGDNVVAGKAMGDYAVHLARQTVKPANRKPVVVELTGEMKNSPDKERYLGFSSVMKRHPEITYRHITTEWSYEGSYQTLKEMLAKGDEMDIVFCHSDHAAMGARQAVEEAHREKEIKILGIDGLPGKDEGLEAVQKGILACTYIYPTHGEAIVELALKILEGKPYPKHTHPAGQVVSPDNVDGVILGTQATQQQAQHLITIQDKLESYLGLYQLQRHLLMVALVTILLLIISILLIWRAVQQIRKAKRQIEQSNQEQTLFYTNARHQLRTPLTLIDGPLKELRDHGHLKDKNKELVDILYRNVQQLHDIIFGVLNFKNENTRQITDVSVQNVMKDSDVQNGIKNMLLKTDHDELATVLIVDDNKDMRQYLHTLLSANYYVLEADDGQSGLKLARESVPDIIVSDVMMPVMDGLQFCQHIKEDDITSHIPVLLLTARSTEEQFIEGYEHGADAYITKPFSAMMLTSRIQNLLQIRIKLHEKIRLQTELEKKNNDKDILELSTPDRRFMDAFKEAITKNMGNSHLKLEDLGAELGMSRVQLYRKVKALTGLTPKDLLRQIRLQQSYYLLQHTDKTINEIAYEIGFGTPGYYSSCFKKQYGKYPTEVRK